MVSDLISLGSISFRLISCYIYNFLATTKVRQGFRAISANSPGTLKVSKSSYIVFDVSSLCLQVFQRLKGQKIPVPTAWLHQSKD
jgi:hypothetical protein